MGHEQWKGGETIMTQQLSRQTCTACRRDSPHVTEEEIAQLRPEIPDWELLNDSGIPKLDRSFKFPNFEQALAFTNAVGQLAESQGHHPKLTTEWGNVEVTWWTHKIRNLHTNDFVMAAKTDQLYAELASDGS